jgi:DNA-binding MarR family transcriptional regulator/predicted GNAT family acetyltransferase
MPAPIFASVPSSSERRIAAVRRFNRFYTQRIGVLRGAWLDSAFSLTEARVLYEIKQRGTATASEIGRDLVLDAGYLSRMLRGFHKRGLIRKDSSPDDARQTLLAMTAAGRKAFAPLEAQSDRDAAAMLGRIVEPEQDWLVGAMQTIENLIEAKAPAGARVTLRKPRPGDFGLIVSRHGILYAEEYGWTENLEGLWAQIVADFGFRYDAARERCGIAEVDGQYAGAAMLAKDNDEVARLRLLLVEPAARGLGVGKRLVDECIAFARQSGYRRITLWTHRVLTAARKIYIGAGFKLTREWSHDDFGKALVAETWDLDL